VTVLRLLAVLFLTAAAAPEPKTVVLTAADFPGRAVEVSAHAVAPAGYVSSIAFTAPYGASQYTKLTSQALVETDAAAAKGAYAVLLRNYSSAAGRRQLIKRYLPAATVRGLVPPRPLGVRPVSTELGFTTAAANLSVSLLRVDRIVVVNIAVGKGTRIVPADARAFALKEATKASTALAPASLTPPEVTGTAKVGQTLTASRGAWSGSPTSYGFQWQACDPSGAPCNDISGATSATYVVRAADVGSALRVHVTARNAFGFSFVASKATAVVS